MIDLKADPAYSDASRSPSAEANPTPLPTDPKLNAAPSDILHGGVSTADVGAASAHVPPPAYPAFDEGQISAVAPGASSPASYPPTQPAGSPHVQRENSPHPQQSHSPGAGMPQPQYFPTQRQPPTPSAPPLTAAQQQAQAGQQYQQQLLAQCAQGHHSATTSYGPCGIISAICLFPIGLIFLLIDKETKCSRCGLHLD